MLTADDYILLRGLLARYRIDLANHIKRPSNGLTPDGLARYKRELTEAETLAEKLTAMEAA